MVGCNLGETIKDLTSRVAKLTAKSEVPATTSHCQGILKGEVNSKTSALTWIINYSDLSGPVTGAYFHRPALKGKNADVAVPITGNLASPRNGMANLSTAQVKDLMEEKWYVNLHTTTNLNEEIRGQITK